MINEIQLRRQFKSIANAPLTIVVYTRGREAQKALNPETI